jgi:hypothetical protein
MSLEHQCAYDDPYDNCSDHIDEEMAGTVAIKFRAHMDIYLVCNTFVSTFRATVMTLRDLPWRSLIAGIQEKVMAQISVESNGSSK